MEQAMMAYRLTVWMQVTEKTLSKRRDGNPDRGTREERIVVMQKHTLKNFKKINGF
jgi:hypothetical protein